MSVGAEQEMTTRFPLTPIQAGLAFESTFGDRSSNVEQFVCRFDEEDVDAGQMGEAWLEVQRRHDALRTTIHLEGPDGPYQQVHPEPMCGLDVVDRSSLSDTDQDRALEEWLAHDRRIGVDLTGPEIMRLSLLEFGRRRAALIWTFHHALLDGRSSAAVLEEALDRYDSPTLNAPATPAPFRRHVLAVSRADQTAAREFFVERFRGWAGPSDGPTGGSKAGPRAAAGEHNETEFRLPEEWMQRAGARAGAVDATVGSILLAAWAVLLARWTDTDDVAFGSTRAGRHSSPGAERMVGCLINTVPLRQRVDPDATVDQLLRSVRAFQVDVRPHEHTALFDISDWVGVGADQHLLSTAVVYERELIGTRLRAKGGPWVHRRVELLEKSSFPLMISAHADEGLRARIEYDTSLYATDTVARMGGHLRRLLESIVESSAETLVGDLTMLTEAEQVLLVDGRNPEPWVGSGDSYVDRFERRVAAQPESIAVEVMGGESIAYGQLDESANRLAHELLESGATSSSPIALCLPRSPAFIVAMLATMKASAPYLPLDPDYPPDDLRHRVSDSGAQLVIATEATSAALSSTDARVLLMDDLLESCAEQRSTAPPRGTTARDALAYVIYTSGTTGQPKGVMVSDGSLVDLCDAVAERYGLTPTDRILQFCSLCFDVSVEEIAPTLLAGGTVVLRSADLSSSMAALVDATARDRLSVLNLPSAIWHSLVTHLERSGARLSRTVRLVVVGGEKVSRHAYESWSAIHPDIRWMNGYGPTETTVTCTTFDPRGRYDVASGRELPIGRPLANARAYVLDRFGRNLVPDGLPGELWIGGSGVALGYLGRPDLTEERFRADPFVGGTAARMYRTGDKVRWSRSGDLEYLGRVDRQIKLRGFRIEPEHIERRLEAMDGVGQAFVSLRSGVSGTDRLVGWVTAADGTAVLDAHELLAQVRSLLPSHLVPAALVQVDDLPRTAAGKVDVPALPDPPVPDRASASHDLRVDGDVTLLCRLFSEVVGAPVGPDDSFFEVGGNSLLAVRLVGLVESEIGVRLSLPELIASPTARELAHSLAMTSTREHLTYLTAIQAAGTSVPLYGLHVIGENASFYRPLSARLGPDHPVFAIAIARPDEHTPTDVAAMAALYVEEIQRHRPDGPLAVAGISLAGFVAFEVAQQLIAAGRDVVSVVLLDSAGPSGERSVGRTRRVRIHLSRLRSGRMSYVQELARRLVDSVRQTSWTIRVRFQQLLGIRTPEELWVHRFVLANTESVGRYQPEPCSSPLLVAHAAGEEFDDPEVVRAGLGWGPFAAGGIEVIDVPGDHMSMLAEPNVETLAEVVRESLDRAS